MYEGIWFSVQGGASHTANAHYIRQMCMRVYGSGCRAEHHKRQMRPVYTASLWLVFGIHSADVKTLVVKQYAYKRTS